LFRSLIKPNSPATSFSKFLILSSTGTAVGIVVLPDGLTTGVVIAGAITVGVISVGVAALIVVVFVSV
jgi:hypothetical protein